MAKRKITEEKKLDIDEIFKDTAFGPPKGVPGNPYVGPGPAVRSLIQDNPFTYGGLWPSSSIASAPLMSKPKLSLVERNDYITNHVSLAEHQLLTGQYLTYNAPDIRRLIALLTRLLNEGIFDISAESLAENMILDEVTPAIVTNKELKYTECYIPGINPTSHVYIANSAHLDKYVRCFPIPDTGSIRIPDNGKIIIHEKVAHTLNLSSDEDKVNVVWHVPERCCDIIYL